MYVDLRGFPGAGIDLPGLESGSGSEGGGGGAAPAGPTLRQNPWVRHRIDLLRKPSESKLPEELRDQLVKGDDSAASTSWTPWIVGGVVALLVGGFLLLRRMS